MDFEKLSLEFQNLINSFCFRFMTEELRLLIDDQIESFFKKHKIEDVKVSVKWNYNNNSLTFFADDTYSNHVLCCLLDGKYIQNYKLRLLGVLNERNEKS